MVLDTKWILGILGAVFGFLLKEAFGAFKRTRETTAKRVDDSLTKNTEALIEVRYSLVKLEASIALLTQKIEPLPRIQQDLNEAHAKIREIRAEMDAKI